MAELLAPRQVGQQASELVAAQAADHIFGTHRAGQPRGHDAQQLVAHGVAMGVVDRLEAVEVEVEHGKALLERHGLHQRALEPFAEEAAVGQQGQVVVQRQAARAPLIGAAADQFDARLRQRAAGFEELEFELLVARALVAHAGMQLLHRRHAIEHAGAQPMRLALLCHRGQPGADGIEQIVPIAHRHIRRCQHHRPAPLRRERAIMAVDSHVFGRAVMAGGLTQRRARHRTVIGIRRVQHRHTSWAPLYPCCARQSVRRRTHGGGAGADWRWWYRCGSRTVQASPILTARGCHRAAETPSHDRHRAAGEAQPCGVACFRSRSSGRR